LLTFFLNSLRAVSLIRCSFLFLLNCFQYVKDLHSLALA